MVKTLTQQQKEAVVKVYTSIYKPKTISELALCLSVSPRTIQRVLDEQGITWRINPAIILMNRMNKNLTVLKGIDLKLE